MARRADGQGRCGRRGAALRASGVVLLSRLARPGSVLALTLLLAGCGSLGSGAPPGSAAGSPPPPGGMGPGSVVLVAATAAPTSNPVAPPSPTAKAKATARASVPAAGSGAKAAPPAPAAPAAARPTAVPTAPPAPTATPARRPVPSPTIAHPAAAPRVVATAPPPTATASDAPVVVHRVQRGETVYHIAKTYGVTVAAILQANHMDDPRKLRAGQLLRVPVPDGVAEANR